MRSAEAPAVFAVHRYPPAGLTGTKPETVPDLWKRIGELHRSRPAGDRPEVVSGDMWMCLAAVTATHSEHVTVAASGGSSNTVIAVGGTLLGAYSARCPCGGPIRNATTSVAPKILSARGSSVAAPEQRRA